MMSATYERKTGKHWLMDLARVGLAEVEKRGIFPRGGGETSGLITGGRSVEQPEHINHWMRGFDSKTRNSRSMTCQSQS
jgi:RNA 3'-terminal phosphate cyclase